MTVKLNGHHSLESIANGQAAAAHQECLEVGIPAELAPIWMAAPERRRWTYWHQATCQNGLTAEEREERLDQVGGTIERAEHAARVAVVDFRTRLREEALNGDRREPEK